MNAEAFPVGLANTVSFIACAVMFFLLWRVKVGLRGVLVRV